MPVVRVSHISRTLQFRVYVRDGNIEKFLVVVNRIIIYTKRHGERYEYGLKDILYSRDYTIFVRANNRMVNGVAHLSDTYHE